MPAPGGGVIGLHVRSRAAHQYWGPGEASQLQGGGAGVVQRMSLDLLVCPFVLFINDDETKVGQGCE